ncbi:T9SS type A sorting domain-containing protein [bacterium]|nr:T9SS type A sorting domain-containing protein [bacterium]
MVLATICGTVLPLTYFRVLVDGTESDTQTQGQSQVFEMDCDAYGKVMLSVYYDVSGDASISPEDYCAFLFGFNDNESGFPSDSDPTVGAIEMSWPVNFPPGDFIIIAYEDADTIIYPYSVYEPIIIDYSLSGKITLEGITPPDELLRQVSVVALDLTTFEATAGKCDSLGDYTCNWFGDTGSVTIMFFELPFDRWNTEGLMPSVEIYGHETGVDITIPRYIPDTGYFRGNISSTFSDIDSLIVLYLSYDDSCGESDTLYIDLVGGSFEVPISTGMCDNVICRFEYYKLPDGILWPCSDTWEFNLSEGSLEYEYYDTLIQSDDTIWLQFDYYSGTPSFPAELPLKIDSYELMAYSRVTLEPGILTPIPVRSEGRDVEYRIFSNCEDCIPDTHGIWFVPDSMGRYIRILAGDTAQTYIRAMRSTCVGTLFTADGGILDDPAHIDHYVYLGYNEDKVIDAGIVNIPVFSDALYSIRPWAEGYMTQNYIQRWISPGVNSINFTMAELDSSFEIFLAGDSLFAGDEEFQVKVMHQATGNFVDTLVSAGTWFSYPISSSLEGAYSITIGNRHFMGIFDYYVENNGSIPVRAGDSLTINIISPISHFCIDWTRDMDDMWETDVWIATHHYVVNYYRGSDTIPAYFTPDVILGDMSIPNIRCGFPIFSEDLNVKIEPAFGYVEEHGFIANPRGYILGPSMLADTIDAYFNYACYHLWIALDGYPAYFLDDDYLRIEVEGNEMPSTLGHLFQCEYRLFDAGEGNLFGYHQLCDADWTIRLPSSLPGGFTPEITETLLHITDPDTFDWPKDTLRIAVTPPPCIHGSIIIEPDPLYPIATRELSIGLKNPVDDSLLYSTKAYRNLDEIEYILLDVERGDYNVVAEYPSPYSYFIYPQEFNLAYLSGDTVLRDIYIGNAFGEITISFDIEPSEIEGRTLIADMLPPDDWFDIVAEYSIEDTSMFINLPDGSWAFTAPIIPGWTVSPEETTIEILDSPTAFNIYFDYIPDISTGYIYGLMYQDETDPSPFDLSDLVIDLYDLWDTPIMETTVAPTTGLFSFTGVPTGDYYITIRNTGSAEAFIYPDFISLSVDAEETTSVTSYIDEANADLIVSFEGVLASEVSISEIAFSTDIPYLPSNFTLPYNTHRIADTFAICDGAWSIYAPSIDTFTISPSDTTIVIDESYCTHNVFFRNTTGIFDGIAKPEDFDVRVYPNPFNSSLSIEIRSEKYRAENIEIFDITGQLIDVIQIGEIDPKRIDSPNGCSVIWEPSEGTGTGIYFIKVSSDGRSATLKGLYIK